MDMIINTQPTLNLKSYSLPQIKYSNSLRSSNIYLRTLLFSPFKSFQTHLSFIPALNSKNNPNKPPRRLKRNRCRLSIKRKKNHFKGVTACNSFYTFLIFI